MSLALHTAPADLCGSGQNIKPPSTMALTSLSRGHCRTLSQHSSTEWALTGHGNDYHLRPGQSIAREHRGSAG